MDSLLASVNWEDIILVGAAMGIFGGTKSLYGTLTKKNGNNKFNKGLCDERHKNIDTRHMEVKTELASINGKLDKVIEHLIDS